HLNVVANASLDPLQRDEVLDISSKFSAIFGGCAHRVLGIFPVNGSLRYRGIEVAGGAASNQDGRIALGAVMPLERIPQNAATRIWRGGDDQRSTRRQQTRLDRVDDLNVSVARPLVRHPVGGLVCNATDVARAPQPAERGGANLNVDSVAQFQRLSR